MSCEEIISALMDLNEAAGETGPSRREEIERHLLTCEQCARDAKELNTLLHLMDASPRAMPGAALKDNFDRMLRSESEKLAAAGLLKEAASEKELPGIGIVSGQQAGTSPTGQSGQGRALRSMTYRTGLASWWKIAAIFLVLAVGIWIGTLLPASSRGRTTAISAAGQVPDSSRGELTGLKNEVKEMKEALLFTLLKQESASQRIQAVSYTEDISNPDQPVINALVNTLNHDKNVNVRLASLYSLARFPNNAVVRDSLVRALPMQTEPIVQIVLINLLTEMKEAKAIKPIRDIISDTRTLPDVKTIAEKGLRTL